MNEPESSRDSELIIISSVVSCPYHWQFKLSKNVFLLAVIFNFLLFLAFSKHKKQPTI